MVFKKIKPKERTYQRDVVRFIHTRPCFGQPDRSKMCENICSIRKYCHGNLYKYGDNKP